MEQPSAVFIDFRDLHGAKITKAPKMRTFVVEKMENEPYHQSLYKSRVCAYAFTLETH
jgi:hypothetical protein